MAREAKLPFFEVEEGEGPVVATAIHAGHAVRDEVEQHLRLDADERRREEDPFTDRFTRIADTRIVVHRSRFEVDLNRPREGAVYRRPEDAWGLRVWEDAGGPPESVVEGSLALYEAFYRRARELLEEKRRRHGAFVVYDLHAYNHRREGPDAPPTDPAGDPDVNLGTGSMDRARWGAVADAFLEAVSRREVPMAELGGRGVRGREATASEVPERHLPGPEVAGREAVGPEVAGRRVAGGEDPPPEVAGREAAIRRLDARENVRFTGGHFPRWVHETFPDSGCALAIEVKKIFMDEWTGEPHRDVLDALVEVLRGTVSPVLRALDRCRAGAT